MCLEFKRQRIRFAIRFLFVGLVAIVYSQVSAQWNFLGAPLISPAAVTSQSLALSTDWHPTLAYTSGGNLAIDQFDGLQWLPVTTNGIPNNSYNDCALAFSSGNVAHIALAPSLGVYQQNGNSWQLITGLPSPSNAQGVQLRIAADGDLWLAWFKAGAIDTTKVFTHPVSGNWSAVGVLEGRVIDMELDDIGEPLLLMANATALLHRVGGIWQNVVPFTTPSEEYFAFEMVHDGSSEGAIVGRRDSSDGLTIELLNFGTWMQLGTAGFATGDIADLGLSFAGTPHVVSVDHAHNGPPRAYHYVAGNWQFLGGQSVYNNKVSQPQWAFDPGAAYLVFRDDEESMRNSVMYLGSPNGEAEQGPEMTVSLWPNPVSTTLHLQSLQPNPGAHVDVVDVMGRRMWTGKLDGLQLQVIDVGSWPAGNYFLRLERSGRSPLHGSFLKQN
jgi:hypothetical protein